MTSSPIAQLRLSNQLIDGAAFDKPADVVGGWARTGAGLPRRAVGRRAAHAGLHGSRIEQALAIEDRADVAGPRTLHFVAAADVRWMLELLTPRVIAALRTLPAARPG